MKQWLFNKETMSVFNNETISVFNNESIKQSVIIIYFFYLRTSNLIPHTLPPQGGSMKIVYAKPLLRMIKNTFISACEFITLPYNLTIASWTTWSEGSNAYVANLDLLSRSLL